MLRFCIVFLSYSSLVYFRRFFFIFPQEISSDIEYSKTDHGAIVSAFSICYTLSKLFLGSANNYLSSGKVLACSLAAVACALLGLSTASSVTHLLIWVPMTSLFQGGAWIAAVKFIKERYDASWFPLLFSIMGCANNASGIAVSFISAESWRTLAFNCGIFGLALTLVVYWLITDRKADASAATKVASDGVGVHQVIFVPTIWKIALFMLFCIEIRSIFEMWGPMFLADHKDTSFERTSFFFEFGGAVGGFLSGVIVQYLETMFNADEARWNVVSISTGILFIASSQFFTIENQHTFYSFVMGLTTYACINVYGMLSADAAPLHMCASASAVVSFLSNLGPVITGSPLAWLVNKYGFIAIPVALQFQTAFFVSLLFATRNIPLRFGQEKQKVN